jgi:hypothetical protein
VECVLYDNPCADVDGRAAAKARVMANDIIAHIDGVPLQGLKSFQAG